MNAFNRVFVIIALAVLLVAGAVTLVSPAFTLGLLRSTADWFRTVVFAGFTDVSRGIARAILAIVWVALMALLLWLELRRPGSRTIEVAHYTGGSAIRISTGAVAEKVYEAVSAAGGVIDAKVKATGRDRAVEIALDVAATKDTDLVQKAEEIATLTRQVVQDQLGLKLAGKPQVSIRAKQGKAINMEPVQRNLPPLTDDAQTTPHTTPADASSTSLTTTSDADPTQPSQPSQP